MPSHCDTVDGTVVTAAGKKPGQIDFPYPADIGDYFGLSYPRNRRKIWPCIKKCRSSLHLPFAAPISKSENIQVVVEKHKQTPA